MLIARGLSQGLTAHKVRATSRFSSGLFLLSFTTIYALLHCLYFALPDALLRDWVHYYGIVLPATKIVNMLAQHEAVIAAQGALQSRNASLSIVRGCDGAGLFFLLVAAVIAYPACLKHKLLGMLGAGLLTYALNELRVVGLYFVTAYQAAWFSPMHNYFIPTLMILSGAVMFFYWIARTQEATATRAT